MLTDLWTFSGMRHLQVQVPRTHSPTSGDITSWNFWWTTRDIPFLPGLVLTGLLRENKDFSDAVRTSQTSLDSINQSFDHTKRTEEIRASQLPHSKSGVSACGFNLHLRSNDSTI